MQAAEDLPLTLDTRASSRCNRSRGAKQWRMTTPTVSNLSAHRGTKKFEALLAAQDPTGLFAAIDHDDIFAGRDSANDSDSDPVLLGPKALVAIKRLYAVFGIVDMPETLAQLRASLHYCKLLQLKAWSIPTDPVNDALWDETVEETTMKYFPELASSLVAYRTGDIEALRVISRDRLTMVEMAKHYDADSSSWVSSKD